MTITREEFKEYIQLYKEAFDSSCEIANYLNENFMDEIMFPAFTWIEKKLGVDNELMYEIIRGRGVEVPTHKRDKNGDIIYRLTTELDEIYDAYFNPAAQINSIIFEQYLQDCDNPYPALLLLEEKLQAMEDTINE